MFQKSVLSLSSLQHNSHWLQKGTGEAAEHMWTDQMWDGRNEKTTLPWLTSLKPRRSTVPLKVKNSPRQLYTLADVGFLSDWGWEGNLPPVVVLLHCLRPGLHLSASPGTRGVAQFLGDFVVHTTLDLLYQTEGKLPCQMHFLLFRQVRFPVINK